MTELHAEWTVPADHPAFPGHFPGQPIVPGVVLLDHALQLAAQLRPEISRWQIGNAKFLSPVGPGESLRFSLVTKASGSLAFTVIASERAVASGSLSPETA
ncbi:MAG: beta-hydroxyacyl-ACP dehydratase [Azonexus sp.]|nr:beta-hydroxyacyl-ACP dehydratase [Azonexus sp.]